MFCNFEEHNFFKLKWKAEMYKCRNVPITFYIVVVLSLLSDIQLVDLQIWKDWYMYCDDALLLLLYKYETTTKYFEKLLRCSSVTFT